MNAESLRIADQLRRAFRGDPWHGPPLRELLSGVTSEQARARPIAAHHTIWELVLHIEIWTRAAYEATKGIEMPKLYGTERDWLAVTDNGAAAWIEAKDQLYQCGEKLGRAIEGFDDNRLKTIVPGRQYDFYYLFHGIVQHSLYHGGQIALLKRAISGPTVSSVRPGVVVGPV